MYEIAPVIEGWSVVLTFYLIWEKPLVVTFHGMNLPTFISSLNTVREILIPWRSPEEDYDSEMLVIPLSNNYAKVPLNYTNLKGTDKLMENLLQSTNELNVHLATVVFYRAGTA